MTQVLPGAVLAGVLLAIALAVPFASSLLLMLAAGALGVALFARRHSEPITRGMGARVGLLSAFLGWAAMATMLALETFFGGGHVLAALRDAMQQEIANNPDPRVQGILGILNSPGGITVLAAAGMLLFLVVLLVCGAAGGALTASLFGKDRNPQK